MPAALRVNGSSSSSTTTITRPTAVQGGDLLVLHQLARNGSPTWTLPAGWTEVARFTGVATPSAAIIYVKTAAGTAGTQTTDATSYTASVNASVVSSLFSFDGATVSATVANMVTANGGSSTTTTAHSTVAVSGAAGDAVIAIAGTPNGAGTYTLPVTAGWTVTGPVATGTNSTAIEGYAAAFVLTATGASPQYLGTTDTALAYSSIGLIVRQAAAAPATATPVRHIGRWAF